MIFVAALAGVPAWVRESFGEKVLRQANRAVMLDIELIEDQDCFIPQATMTGYLHEIERRAGERHLGLHLAPHLSFASYGLWAEYVLGATSLRGAIARTASTLAYHSRGDRMGLSVTHGVARLSYFNATRGRPGYAHVAVGTASVLLDLVRSYLSPDWRPRMIELDHPRNGTTAPYEDTFLCPVVFDAPAVSVCFDAHLLDCSGRPGSRERLMTYEDLERLRFKPDSFDDFLGAVVAQVWAQVFAGTPSIESAALSLDRGVRTLQRELNREGVDFRGLVNAVRARRAQELLSQTPASVTEISSQLGYSTPANFARAFRKATGVTPKEFRSAFR